MYAAVYGYGQENGRRKHLGNVTNIDYTFFESTFEFGNGQINGISNIDVSQGLIVVVNNESGNKKFAGFFKNYKNDEKSEKVSFVADDFKKIFDTDVILDFSQTQSPSHTIHDIFEKVCQSVLSVSDPFISNININYTIPADTTDTKEIGNYTGQYLIVNAKKFLKVYLSYFAYLMKVDYDVVSDTLSVVFSKAEAEPLPIKIIDFIHEKTSNDIKTNKVIATIKFETVSDEPSWITSDLAYFNESINNRGVMIGLELPDVSGYAPSFALKLIESLSWAQSDIFYYNNSSERITRFAPWPYTYPPTVAPTYQQSIDASGDVSEYSENSAIKVCWFNFQDGIVYSTPCNYIKTVAGPITYHKMNEYTFNPRPALPQKIYTLGKNNNIYEGYASDELRFYPIVSKIFESNYLSEAQINAVYELVNNRYIENILLTIEKTQTPYDLSELELYTMIRAYDANGDYKDIPISEKTTTFSKDKDECVVKLGFKKTLLTEIIKAESDKEPVIKQVGGGSGGGTNIFKFEPWDGSSTPDPNEYDTWFKPVEE